MESGHNRQAQLVRPTLAHSFQQNAKVEGAARWLSLTAVVVAHATVVREGLVCRVRLGSRAGRLKAVSMDVAWPVP